MGFFIVAFTWIRRKTSDVRLEEKKNLIGEIKNYFEKTM